MKLMHKVHFLQNFRETNDTYLSKAKEVDFTKYGFSDRKSLSRDIM